MFSTPAFKLIAMFCLSLSISGLPACSKSDQAAEDIAAIRKIKEKEQADKEAAIKKGEETQKSRAEALKNLPR
jgi:hypothetical protein